MSEASEAKIVAPLKRELSKLKTKLAEMDPSDQLGAFSARLDILEAQIAHVMENLAHLLPEMKD